MKLGKNETLLFIGDSITDAGRARPVGEGGGLGGGYPAQVAALLGATYPDRNVRVLNTGISGNTVRHLDARWKSDVLDLKPDWLSIMIGTNDVWRQFDKLDKPVLPDEFEATLRRLIEQTRPLTRGISLLTPFFVQADRRDPMRARMDEYGMIVKRIGKELSLPVGDTQRAFDDAMGKTSPLGLAGDRVHPSPSGHMILSRTFLKTIDYRW